TLSFQRGEARLDANTKLAHLNAGDGVPRGTIRITDRSGASSTVDLTQAMTVNDVLDAINSSMNVNVTASVDGDRLKLTDNTGMAGEMSVADVSGGGVAAALGLVGATADPELIGEQVNRLGDATLLSNLNDGNGIRTRTGSSDIRITDANGTNHDIDLSGLDSLGEMIQRINTTTGGAVTAGVGDDGVSLKLTDTTGGGGGLNVTARNNSKAGEDLGLLGSHAGEATGHRLVAGLNTKLTRNLNGGAGLDLGTIQLTNRQGAATDIDLTGADSIHDIIRRINDAGAGVTASLNDAGNGLKLTDTTGGSGTLAVADLTGQAAEQLNLVGSHDGRSADTGNLSFRFITEATRMDRLGVNRGQFTLTDSAGNSATVDLTQGDEQTLGDVINEINSRGLAIHARINDTGDGLLLEDTG
ncbi:flagellin hook IN motif-containing protein, partial [Phycisphaerales bacterium AB-hyl4]